MNMNMDNKQDATTMLAAFAGALLAPVEAANNHAPDPFCEAVRRFIDHLQSSGDFTDAANELLAVNRASQRDPLMTKGRSASAALVLLLMLALGSPNVSQHVTRPYSAGKVH
jgi:hypothetical protein